MVFNPPFRAYQGFLELIPAGEIAGRIGDFLDDAIGDLERFAPGPGDDTDCLRFDRDGDRGYTAFRLVDTFLDPDCARLESILRACREAEVGAAGRPILQLLLMSPFSQLGSVRYAALAAAEPGRWQAESPLEHMTLRMHEVVGILARVLHRDRPQCPDPRSTHFAEQLEAFDRLIDLVADLGREAGFEVRFYDQFTDAPLYFFGKFIFKGVILDRNAAANNPWLAFVDDPNQPADLYDSLVRRIDALWRGAYHRPMQYGLRLLGEEPRIRALIAMPMAEERELELTARKDAIVAACEAFTAGELRIEAKRIDDVPTVNRSIDDLLVEAIRQSDLMIADLSGNRANVYYEAGLAQAMNKPVLFVVAEDSRTEVGFDLRNYRILSFASNDDLEQKVRRGLREIFVKLGHLAPEDAAEPV